MLIREESIFHYLNWFVEEWHFAFAGYSDAEWFSILSQREGEATGLGQILSSAHGKRLLDILRRRQNDPRFLFAIPKCINQISGFAEGQIDWFLGRQDIQITAYERDRVTDELAKDGLMYPLVRQLQDMNVVMIGPEPLRVMTPYLKLKHFIPISTPNLHLEEFGIEKAVAEACKHHREHLNCQTIYLVSAGMSAAVIIDQLYSQLSRCWFFDCGSIWDAFAGIGSQRQWRAELYVNADRWKRWKVDNLEGKHTPINRISC